MNGWAGFWIFMAVLFVGDTWLYSKGHDTYFWKYKTDAEKEIQRAIIDRLKQENEEARRGQKEGTK